MTPLVLSLALTAPAHPPAYRPAPPPPVVRVQPQVPVVPTYRPVVVPTYPTPVYQPPVYQPPVYQPVYPVQPIQPIAPQAVTLGEFSRFFTPTPGKHHVWIIHPVSRVPVQVCFVLPGGKLREFEVDSRSIRFEFRNGEEVEIDFRKDGTVRVHYDD